MHILEGRIPHCLLLEILYMTRVLEPLSIIPKKMRGIIMADKQLMERAEQALYKVYNRFPVVFDHGEGVKLYDTEGNEYLDFGAGIAVMALGYGDEEYTKAVEEQLHKLTHISNLFYNQPSIEPARSCFRYPIWIKCFHKA